MVENQWWSSLMHWRYHYSSCCSYGVCQCILSHRVIILQGDWWRAEGEQVGEKSGLWHSISPTSFVVSDFFGLSSCMLKLSDVCESNAHLNFEAWCSLYYFNQMLWESTLLAKTKLLAKLLMGATEVSGWRPMQLLHMPEVGHFN